MFAEGIRIRSFHAGCAHEVKLPGGKTLLIDPFFRDSLSGGKTYSPETDIAKEAAERRDIRSAIPSEAWNRWTICSPRRPDSG